VKAGFAPNHKIDSATGKSVKNNFAAQNKYDG
jgi:hypothetical protein